MIYLACFAASGFFAYLANRAEKRRNFILFSAVSILLPVLLAGLRDYSIGTDVDNYLNLECFWKGAISADSAKEYVLYYRSTGLREKLFAWFIGIIAQTTGEFRVFLFVCHFIVVCGMYVGAFRLKHHAPPEAVLVMFYLLYFNSSLNLIRQFMALAVVFAFMADLEKHKLLYYLRYFLATTIMVKIHSITLIAYAPALIMFILYTGRKSNKMSTVRMGIICALILIGTVFFRPLVGLILDTRVLSGRYQYYFNYAGVGQMSKVRIVLLLLELGGIIVFYRKLRKNNSNFDFYLVNFAAFVAMQIMAPSIHYGFRLTYYFAFANLVLVAMLPTCLEKKWHRAVAYAGIFALMLFYWNHHYVAGGAGETFPYLLGTFS